MQITSPIPLETKASSGGIEGYGSVFGNVDFGGDVVLPGAFSKSLQEYKDSNSMPSMFWMHKMDSVPGKWTSASEDTTGLLLKGDFANTPLGSEIRTLTKMDAVSGLSIGYITKDFNYDKEGNRLLKQVDLLEVSVVSIPMNPKAQVTNVKSRTSAKGEYVPDESDLVLLKREIEDYLKFKGFGRRAAKAGVAFFFKGFTDETSEVLETVEKIAPVKSPDEIEVEAGLLGFREKQDAYELNKILARYFR